MTAGHIGGAGILEGRVVRVNSEEWGYSLQILAAGQEQVPLSHTRTL